MDAIVHDLKARCEFGQFALVVIDSCSCFVEGDENKSVDVRAFAAKVLQVSEVTGATVLPY
jgi:RecA-family ATPase